jgi:hypothetical protein
VRIEHDLALPMILMGEPLANYVKSLDCRCELASEARTKTGNELLRGFLHRKNYTLRRKTTTGRTLPKDFLEKINQFHQDCALNFIDDVEFDPNTLVNMDGTSIYLDIFNIIKLCLVIKTQ